MNRVKTTFAVLHLAVLLAACGGGGGGTTVLQGLADPNALFQGQYESVGIMGQQLGGDQVAALWGEADADGAGLVSVSWGMNQLGVIMPAGPASDGEFDVQLDRTIGISPIGPGLSIFRGGISENGDLAALMGSFDGMQPMLFTYGRRVPGTHDDTSLQGTWHYACYGANNVGPLNVAGWGTMTFDGSGAGTYEESINQEGATFGPVNPPLTYEVFADGKLGIQFAGGMVVYGALTGGGQVVIAAGGSLAGDNPATYVLVRAGAGLSDADLEGTYSMLAFMHHSATNAYACINGALLADGMGGNFFAGLQNEDGTLTQTPMDNVTTSVAPNGAVELTTAGGDVLHGGLSQDGRYLVAAGTSTPGGDPTFVLLLR